MGNVGEIEEMERLASSSSSSSTRKLPLLSLNHVSFVCKAVAESVRFYQDVLGFALIKRPSSFDFEGAWLFNYGVGIHLLQSNKLPPKKPLINPKDNHISFQCTGMEFLMKRLKQQNIEFVTAVVREGGITVDQIFFHDPDGYMIEICNCQNLPVLPLSSSSSSSFSPLKVSDSNAERRSSAFCAEDGTWSMLCTGAVASLMLENLVAGMMNISI